MPGRDPERPSHRAQLPIGLSLAGNLACGFIDLAFLGHLSSDYLAAASTATLWLSVTSTFLWQGFGNAMAALVSQVRAVEESAVHPRVRGTPVAPPAACLGRRWAPRIPSSRACGYSKPCCTARWSASWWVFCGGTPPPCCTPWAFRTIVRNWLACSHGT